MPSSIPAMSPCMLCIFVIMLQQLPVHISASSEAWVGGKGRGSAEVWVRLAAAAAVHCSAGQTGCWRWWAGG